MQNIDIEIQQSLFIPTAILTFIWGLIWGSFFNVCIYRIPAGKSVVKPGSHCYTCGSAVKWFDNIPLVSYLLLRGNCRTCGTHFSPRYFFIELLTGILFLITFLQFGFQWQTPFHMIFLSLLLIGTFTDIDYFIIPDGITIGGTIYAVLATGLLGPYSYIANQMELAWEVARQLTFQWHAAGLPVPLPYWYPFAFSLFGAAFGWMLLWSIGFLGKIIFRKEAMGMGDVKLFALLGAWMGPLNCIWILFLSAFIGSFFGLSLLLAHKLVGKDQYGTLVLEGTPTVNLRTPAVKTPLEESLKTEEPDTRIPEILQTHSEVAPVELKFPLKTARQLHHFPYGPYIAVAAAIVLLMHESIDEAVRTFFLLK